MLSLADFRLASGKCFLVCNLEVLFFKHISPNWVIYMWYLYFVPLRVRLFECSYPFFDTWKTIWFAFSRGFSIRAIKSDKHCCSCYLDSTTSSPLPWSHIFCFCLSWCVTGPNTGDEWYIFLCGHVSDEPRGGIELLMCFRVCFYSSSLLAPSSGEDELTSRLALNGATIPALRSRRNAAQTVFFNTITKYLRSWFHANSSRLTWCLYLLH